MKFVIILFVCTFVVFSNEVLGTEQHSQHDAKGGELAGGHEGQVTKYSEFKHGKKSGKSKKHDEEKARKAQLTKELHQKMHSEGAGKKTKHHDEGGHKSSHEQKGGSGHGAKFHDAAMKKKLNYKKGFREKYHKDEHKKHNSFYSNGHKTGEFEVYGSKHSKFNSKHSSKKQIENHKAANDQSDYKKSSTKVGGHDLSEKKGHKDQKSAKSHHNHQDKYAKKGGKKGGKQYKYKVSSLKK